ncbi:MAG: cytochrome c biogenesis protein CcsA [Nannocystaceae bacterium]|nr:cytochrome c biogenesis protein [bacterium]
MKNILPFAMLGVAALIFPTSVSTIFLETPIEQQMGTVQKIFYFHVPLAWIMMLLAVVCGVSAGIQLRRDSKRAEAVSIAAAELVLVTGLGVLITGPIWGHATWGKAWTWDARQVSTGLLWLVFAAYVLVRHYGAAGSERLAAGLAIFGAIDVPVIYYAVKIWKTTHPSNDVAGSLPASMWAALWPALIALLLTSLALLFIRVRQELTDVTLDEAWISLDDAGAAQPATGDA